MKVQQLQNYIISITIISNYKSDYRTNLLKLSGETIDVIGSIVNGSTDYGPGIWYVATG